MNRPITHDTSRFNFNYSVSAAKKYIDMFYQLRRPTTEQRCMLAAAHYTLALQDNIPTTHCKMHTNTAITLLQNVRNRTEELNSMIASAYFKRAELFEQENSFDSAAQDYQKIIAIFEHLQDISSLSPQDKLLIAQSAISLADLLLHQHMEVHPEFHPLFYVNQSLKYLSDLPREQEEIWTTLAYAHQIAGLALASIDRIEAKESFRTAISMAFRTDPKIACQMLADIYNSLGLLYEQQFIECPIQKVPANVIDHALLYFGMALLFQSTEEEEFGEEGREFELIDTIFDCIYRVLDPYLPELSKTVTHDLIDALIFAYYCVSDELLPNPNLCQKLKNTEVLGVFSQHIYGLVIETFRREHHDQFLLDIIRPQEHELTLDLTSCLDSLMNPSKNKIFYISEDKN